MRVGETEREMVVEKTVDVIVQPIVYFWNITLPSSYSKEKKNILLKVEVWTPLVPKLVYCED